MPPSRNNEAPHSIEAEEYLLSAIFLDGADVMARCLIARLRPADFYDSKHQLIYSRCADLYQRGESVEIGTVAQELDDAKELDQVGGWPFLTQVSSRLPTTLQAPYYVGKVKALATRRELIRQCLVAIEECRDQASETDELLSGIRARFDRIEFGDDLTLQPIVTSFALPPADDPTALLGRHRYICRGDGAVVVSSAGMGKSVMNYEWAMHAALGRPFLGIETKAKLTSLIIQSEDSAGDIGEVVFSLCTALKLSDEERAEVDRRVFVVTDKVNSGDAFLARLRQWVERVKPDLVWLNPLHAFAGCDIADAKELGRFLRRGLNGVNKEGRFAYMIVHHTPKPITGKNVGEKKWHEFMYDAAGSAELVNWARAVITLKPTETEGHFNLVLAKRGKRAGVMIAIQGEMVSRLELTTKIPIKHSTTQIKIEGRAQPFSILHWEAREPDTEAPTSGEEKAVRDPGHSAADFVIYYPPNDGEPETMASIARFAASGCLTRPTVYRWKDRLIDAGLIEQLPDTRWRRTARGDALANDTLKSRK